MSGQDGADPWQSPGGDPWGGTATAAASMYRGHSVEPEPQPSPPPSTYTAPPRPSTPFPDGSSDPTGAAGVFVQVPPAIEPAAQRIIHDVPPTWDGSDPPKQCAPYLKALKGWMNTTRAQKSQQGMTILHYAAGDLKAVIDE